MKICQDRGGNIAILRKDWEINEVKKLFHKNSEIVKSIQNYWVHPNTSEYFPSLNIDSSQHDDTVNSCVILQHDILSPSEFTVMNVYP